MTNKRLVGTTVLLILRAVLGATVAAQPVTDIGMDPEDSTFGRKEYSPYLDHGCYRALVAVLTLFLLSACAPAEDGPAAVAAQAEDGVWTIASRKLPPPVAASDALRASIANASQPSVAESVRHTPASLQEWELLISTMNAGSTQNSGALAERWSVKIKEDEIAGVTVRTVTPTRIDPANVNRLFVHVHGGAYVLNAGLAGVAEAILIAHRAKIPVLSIDYRMPPEHPFPAAVDDVVAVWESLLGDRPAKSMALGGTSAGGGLTLASTLRFIEIGLETPGALWAGTPWTDLTKTGDSHFTMEGIDRMLVTYDGVLEGAAKLYAGGRDLRTPLISPVYGDFEGFPPTYLVTGTRDLLLSDTVRVHRKMRVAGVVAELNIYEGLSHGEYASVVDSSESEQTFGELGAFLLQHLDRNFRDNR